MTAQPPPYGPYGPRQQPPAPHAYGSPYGPTQPAPYRAVERVDAQPWLQYGPPYPMPSREVTRSRKRTSHGLHLFLTICTFGVWGLLVWLPLSLWHRFGPKAKSETRWS
jgi:hypothetical protein